MANTYTKLFIQFVFAVKGRENLISESFRDELEKVICSIISSTGSKVYSIYCNPDHTHVLVSLSPSVSPSKIMELVKAGSSNWLNSKIFTRGKFSWQKGFGAFTYSHSHVDGVVKYILNQAEHHKRSSFKDEYLSLLEKFDIKYNDDYLFEWYD